MRITAAAAGLAFAIAALGTQAAAAGPAELKFGFYPPATSYVNTEGLTPWIERVERASGGTLAIKLFPGPTLGTERNMYDRVLNNVVQVGYSTLGQLASQFPRAQVSGLPFLSDDTGLSSMAYWRSFARGAFAREFDSVKVLALFNFPSSNLNTNKPVKVLEDIRGLKLAVSSRLGADATVAFGASPVTLVTTEFYEGLQRGVADGALSGWTAVKTFKLAEVTKDHLELPFGEAPAFVFMNKAAYAGLSPQAKHAIDGNSGEALSKILGENNAAQGRAESKTVAAEPGQTVVSLPAAEAARWKERIEPVIAEWTKQTPDGANVLAIYRAELKQLGMEK